MEQVYLPLISGLVGALIGAAASIGAVWVQAKTQDRREKLRHATELALEDYKFQLDQGNESGQSFSVPPLSLFLHYHLGLMELMEKDELNTETMRKLARQNTEFYDVIKELNEERKGK